MTKKNNTTKLIVLALIFILASVIISQSGLFSRLRADLTENNLYSLSDGTRNILSEIDEQIHLKLFYSDEATRNIPILRTYYKRVKDFLQEMARYSGGSLKLSFIDPLPFSEEEDQAAQYGLQSLPVGEGGESVFFGIAASNALDDTEVLPFLQPDRESFLEYDLAQLIHNLNAPKKPVIGVLSSLPLMGEMNMQTMQPEPGLIMFEQLRKLYQVNEIASDAESIDGVDLLMLVHPKNLSEKTLFAIDQFVLSGGRLIAFVDPLAQSEEVDADPQNPMAQLQADRSSDLAPLFQAWGVTYRRDQVVLDNQHAVSIQTSQSGQPVRHLGIMSYGAENLNADDIVALDIDAVNVAVVGEFSAEAADRLIPILTSSDDSMVVPVDPMSMLYNPNGLFQRFTPDAQQHILAARLQGAIQSAYPNGIEGVAADQVVKENSDPQIVLFADVDLLYDRMWVRAQNFFGRQVYTNFADNGSLLTNLADNMTGSADLIKVRARGISARPFDKVNEIRLISEQKYRETENQLKEQLRETEAKLNELQRSKGQENHLILSQQQEQELRRFTDRKLEVRKKLREVRRNLDKDIDQLGSRMKFINIALIPILLTLVAIFFSWRQGKRKERKYDQ